MHALKVKRKGHFYYLSSSMYVRSAFDGLMGSWFLYADASSVKGQNEITHSCKPDSRNARLAITNDNSSADVVDLLLPDGPSRRFSNIYDLSLPKNADKQHEKQNLINQDFGSGNSSEEVHDNAVSVDVDPKDGSVAKQKGLSVNYDSNGEMQLIGSSNANNESVVRIVAASLLHEGMPVLKKHVDYETEKPENGVISENELKSPEETSESGPAKKKRKTKKTGANSISVTDNGASVSETIKRTSRLQEMKSSNDPLVGKLQSEIAISENAELLEDNHKLADTTSGKQRKRKRQASHSSEVVGAISSVENVGGESCGVTEVINHQDLGREADAVLESGKTIQGGTVSVWTASPKEGQRVDETSKIPSPVEDETGNIGLGNVESHNEAAALEVAQVKDNSTQIETVAADARTMEPGKSAKKKKKTKKTQVPDVVTLKESEVEHLRGSVTHTSPTELPTPTNENGMNDTGIAIVEKKNEAANLEAVPVKGDNMLVDQDANHVGDYSSHVIQEPSNLQPENLTVAVENGTVRAGKSKRKRKKSGKTQETDVEASVAMEREHVRESNTVIGNGQSKNDAGVLEALPVKDANMLVDQHASHVEDHSSPMIEELNNLMENRVTGFENLTVAVEVENQEVRKSSKKKKKSRRTHDPDVGTAVVLGAEHLRENNDGAGYRESKNDAADLVAVPVKDTSMLLDQHTNHIEDRSIPISLECINLQESRVTGSESLAANAVVETLEAEKTSRKRKSRKAQGSNVERPMASQQEHLRESLEDISLTPINDKADNSTQLKEAPTKETMIATPDNEAADDAIRDVLDFLQQSHKDKDKKSKKKTKKKGSSTPAENVDTEGRDDLDRHAPETLTDSLRDVNPSAESSKLADKATDVKGADNSAIAVKKKKKADVQSAGASSEIQKPVKSSENLNHGGFAESAGSDPIQKHKSSLKSAKESDSVTLQSKKKLATVSGSRKELPVSNENKSGNEHKSRLTAVASGTIDRTRNTLQTPVAVRKDHGNNKGKAADSSDRKRSLLEMSGSIFKDDGKESSDDEGKTIDSDATTRTPSNKSFSSESSDSDADSKQAGPYSQIEEGVGGKNKKPLSSSPRSGMSLAAILRSSKRYRQAKITASQSQVDDSQLEETVPESQPR